MGVDIIVVDRGDDGDALLKGVVFVGRKGLQELVGDGLVEALDLFLCTGTFVIGIVSILDGNIFFFVKSRHMQEKEKRRRLYSQFRQEDENLSSSKW